MTSETSVGKKKNSKARGKSKATDKPPKKRGPPPKFKGLRHELMMRHFQVYIDPDKPFKLSAVEADYWSRVPWREHNLCIEVDADLFNNASVPPDQDGSLTPEEEDQKKKIMDDMSPVSSPSK